MKTLYITRGVGVTIDTESNSIDRNYTARQGIDEIFLIKEPVHVVYCSGEYKKELDAEEGDIVISFYNDLFKNQMIVVKNNKEWVENIVDYEKRQQEEKERWAASKKPECEGCSESKDN